LVAKVATRAVTLVPEGTVEAVAWLPSLMVPVTAGFSAWKLKAVIAFAED